LNLDDSLAAARYQLAAARYQLGVVLLASNDAPGAEAALTKVTVQQPRWPSVFTALGMAYYGGGKFAEAMNDLTIRVLQIFLTLQVGYENIGL
jgi:predicted Zn-dependent protease